MLPGLVGGGRRGFLVLDDHVRRRLGAVLLLLFLSPPEQTHRAPSPIVNTATEQRSAQAQSGK